MTTSPRRTCFEHFLNHLRRGGRITKMAGVIASRAPHLAAAVVASGPLVLSGATAALGQTWDGSTSTDWFTGSNWTSNTAPNSSQDVFINTTTPNPATVTDKTTNGTADANDLVVGDEGQGFLTVSNSGALDSYSGSYIGYKNGSTGSVEVTGTGSIWDSSYWIYVGDYGDGTLTVSDGGAVSSADSIIGRTGVSSGRVEVTGTGSTWTNAYDLVVGSSGDGTLTISEDAVVNVSGVTRLGSDSPGSGVLNIGAVAGDAAVGAGELNTAKVIFGPGTGTINFHHTDSDYTFSADISGTGSVNQLSGTTILTGTNTFTGGTTVSGGTLELRGGSALSDSGEIIITGGRLQLTNSETVGGTTVDGGVLAISAGETLTTGTFTLADGTVIGGTLQGSSYTVENGSIATALTGTSALTKTGSGTVTLTGTNTYTGDTIVSGGMLELRGGSVLTDTEVLRVGYAGTGALTIAEGSEVNSGYLNIGRVSGSVTVTGSGSSLDVAAISKIGLYGTGTLTISDGGRVTNGQSSIIGGPDATGAVTVTDDGSAWEAGFLVVGQYGAGSLKIENGGKVTSGRATIGFDSTSFSGTSSGIVTVTGEGSIWESRDRINVGDRAPGTLTIADDAIVDVDGDVVLAFGAVSQGTLNIGAAAGETAVKAGTLDTEEVRFGDGTGVINFNHTDTAYVFAPKISGDGRVNQLSGTTILTGINTYTGGTTVSGGKLVVDGTIGDVAVDGGSLGGSGTINGSATVTSGTIAAGNSPGTLTIGGDLNLTSASVLDFELGSPSGTAGVDSDLIAVGGDLTLDGSLNVTDAGGFDAGVYNLITYGGSLTDNGLEVGTAPTGLLYNVQTATAGQVNLLVNPDQLSFWNGAVTSADGTVHGGSGSWSMTGTNWTDATGSASAPYQPDSTLIFQGTPGSVTVDSAGVSVSKGMQFAADGYTVTGGDIIINAGADTVSFRVGEGTSAGAGFTSTIASNLTGAGSLEKTGLGTLVLTGDNTYNGTTTVSEGALEFRDGATLSGGQNFRVGSPATASLTIADGSDVSARDYTFVARGSGSSGAVTVTGPNSRFQAGFGFIVGYNGNGTLSILEGGLVTSAYLLIGSFAGSTGAAEVIGEGSHWKNYVGLDAQGTSLDVGRQGTGTLTIAEGGRVTSQKGVIGSATGSSGDVVVSGDGSLWENSHYMNIGLLGRGTLTISDGGVVDVENSVHLGRETGSHGTLNIGAAAGNPAQAAGILDAAAVKFGDGTGVINFNHTDTDYTFSHAISGGGTVNQLAGTTILTGTNTYTGGSTVSGGKLVVNGSIGDVTINGGSLGGSGTVGAVAFNSGAVVAPGSSIGTLNATSLVFNSGSTFEVELNDGGNAAGINNDLLAASGTLTINGGMVHVKPENGTDDGSTYAANTVYTIMSAVGGVSGTFDSAPPTDDFAFLDFVLSYDANNVYLGSQMTSSTFCISGMSANQCATGEGAFSLGSGGLFNSVLNLSNSDAAGALDQLSGEAHASIKTALIEDSRFAREAALSRVRIAMDSVAADGQEQVEKRVGESLAFWGQSFGSWGRWSGNRNVAGLDRSIGGFLLGGDAQIGENSRLGFFGGYDNSSFEVNGRTSSATADTLHLGAYGGTEFGPLGVRAGGSYAWHDIDTTRSVAFTGFAENLSGSYTVRIAQIFGEAGYRFDYAATSLEPFANISYIQLSGDGYSETGGSAALKAGRQTMDSTFTSIGLRAETRANLGQFNAKLSAQAAWQHAFGDVTPVVNHAFAGGDDFSVAGIPIARDALLLNLGASVELGRNTTLGLAYGGRFGSGFTDQGLKANIALKF